MEGGDAVGDGLGGGGLFLSGGDAEEGVAGWGVKDAGLVETDFFIMYLALSLPTSNSSAYNHVG